MEKKTPRLSLTVYLNQFINASASGRRVTPSGKKIVPGTIANYRYALRLVQEFEQDIATQFSIRLLHRVSLRCLQQEKNYWRRFFTGFSHFLYNKKNYRDNYVGNVFKVLKTFFNYLDKEKGYVIGHYHKSFRIPLLQASPVVLLPWQLNFLISNRDFEQTLSPCLRRVKDIFVIGCTVALRYSDLMRLKKSNIINTDGESFLVFFTSKTGTEVRIPLPGYVLETIRKHKSRTGKWLLPRLSSTNLNLQVKKLVKAAGWDNLLLKTISCKGRMMEIKTAAGKTWPFYQHITTHTMRRTAITTLLMMGVPESVVRKVSGHAPGSKEFFRYVAIAQEYLNKELKEAYKKIGDHDFSKVADAKK